jgi:thiamine kinase
MQPSTALRAVLGLADASFEPLPGGYWNRVWRVGIESAAVVVKQFVPVPDNPMFPQLPGDEAAALQMFAGCSVAPRFVDFVPDAPGGPVLVYEYLDGVPWQSGDPSPAAVFRRAHRSEVAGSFRVLPTDPAAIIDQAERMLVRSRPEDADRVRAHFHSTMAPGSARRCLVHTDGGPGNIIVTAGGPRLIDWQCPGIGDPVEDLVTFVSPAMQILYGCPPLSDDDEGTFLAGYDDEEVTEGFRTGRIAYHLRIAAYCAFRTAAVEETDPVVSHRYRRALDAELWRLDRLR